jgi:hypothetical protein
VVFSADDVFTSTVHRAINRSGVRRYSIPLFFGTDYDVRLEVRCAVFLLRISCPQVIAWEPADPELRFCRSASEIRSYHGGGVYQVAAAGHLWTLDVARPPYTCTYLVGHEKFSVKKANTNCGIREVLQGIKVQFICDINQERQ